MCGIVGLFLKSKSLEPRLGEMLSAMLIEMTDRGPDSAGFAIYGDDAPAHAIKFTLYHPSSHFDWDALTRKLDQIFKLAEPPRRHDSHSVFALQGAASEIRSWLTEHYPDIKIMGVGSRVEIFKHIGLPVEVATSFGLAKRAGTHALGHTRMATESAVTTEHSHPFSTDLDLCLVHNGSLSNHNRLRQKLIRNGIHFDTDNDSEVAAGFLTDQMHHGATLNQALEAGLEQLDGFFTFAVGTRDGFAILRDPLACKPAVLAETDDWVAMASEYRAIAMLPGAAQANVWEPQPAVIYEWHRGETG